MTSPRQRRKARKRSHSTEKGRLVETIVAHMHKFPEAVVEMNVRLPAVDGSGRVREIDVLISGSLTGYPVQIAIECKNYGQTIEVETIDSFVGKLDDIGIPRQHGIIVTVKGFSSGALKRAATAGIRPLVLTGLTDDRLAAEIASAFMSIIYLLPVITGWTMVNSVASVTEPAMMFTLYDTNGDEAGVLLDLVWWQWRDGVIPSLIGKHEVPVGLPPGWHMKFDGKPEVPIRITYEITVFGLVLVVPGTAAKFGLLNAGSGSFERFRIEADFKHDLTSEHRPLAVLNSEAEATQFLKRQESAVSIVQRIRLPRLRSAGIYWPISARARSRLEELLRPDHNGRVPSYEEIDWSSIEGQALDRAFDPIWKVPRRPGN